MKSKTDLKSSCANCKLTNCINLFRHTRNEDKHIGGELYIYKSLKHSGEQEFWKYICFNGKLLECACFIVHSAYDNLPREEYLPIVSNEVVRDMKASFYLAMSGHYRQAILIQRCVLENFLYGLYFTIDYHRFSHNDSDRKRVKENFNSWVSGGFRKGIPDLLDLIERAGYINKGEMKDWEKLYRELSNFVHSIRHTPTGKKIKHGNIEIPDCYAEVEYNEKDLIEWSNFYQRVMFLILHRLFDSYPFIKRLDAGKIALIDIKACFKDLEKELMNSDLDAILKMRSGKSIVASLKT
jgi:hypothetical protein